MSDLTQPNLTQPNPTQPKTISPLLCICYVSDIKIGRFKLQVALESGGSGGVVWRIRANATKLVCAVGSRNGTEETKLLVLDFDVQDGK